MRFFRILVRIFSGGRTPPPPPAKDPPFRSTQDAIAVLRRSPSPPPARETILRRQCWVIDGDTIDIAGTRIRLAGIDAPELDHPWGKRSKWPSCSSARDKVVTARIRPELSYDRVVAECFLPDGCEEAVRVRGRYRSSLQYRHPARSKR